MPHEQVRHVDPIRASPLFKGNDVAKVMKSVPHTARNITSLQKLLAKLGPE